MFYWNNYKAIKTKHFPSSGSFVSKAAFDTETDTFSKVMSTCDFYTNLRSDAVIGTDCTASNGRFISG
jgi:hypothetical protein